MDRCWLQGAAGDALHALSCALGYNIRWLMRALLAQARRALLWLLQRAAASGEQGMAALLGGVLKLTAMMNDESNEFSARRPAPWLNAMTA